MQENAQSGLHIWSDVDSSGHSCCIPDKECVVCGVYLVHFQWQCPFVKPVSMGSLLIQTFNTLNNPDLKI